MTTKHDIMSSKPSNSKTENQIFLLHTNYRFSGYLILTLGLLVAAWNKIVDNSLVIGEKSVNGTFSINGQNGFPGTADRFDTIVAVVIIVGLLCIACAKEKVEDEMFMMMRLKAMRTAFFLAILYVVAVPVLQLLGNSNLVEFKGTTLMIGMLSVYLIAFTMEKKRSLL